MLRLVTPLDGSVIAEQALALSRRLAERLSGSIELVHVVETAPPRDLPIPDARDEAERYLIEVAGHTPSTIPIQTHVLDGIAVDELLRFSDHGCDTIIVMSTHGRTSLQRTPMGSVADKLVRRTSVPVLLVNAPAAVQENDLHDILVPLDGSELAETALRLAMRLAGNKARLCLVRVIQPPDGRSPGEAALGLAVPDTELLRDITNMAVDDARTYLFNTALKLREQGFTVGWEVRFGHPSNEILRASETMGSDLIVMATHGWGGLRRWTFGSVTDAVIRRGSVSVLVVPSSKP